ncbi:MAG: nicotinamide mononucleotide transporter [Rickettsiales bacterium]|nr:nicotinamide mononucleotide transporter [Rickettsiales bacterium]
MLFDFLKKNFELVLFSAAIVALAAFLRFSGAADVQPLEFFSALVSVAARPLLKRESPAGIVLSIIANIAFLFYFAGMGLLGLVALNVVFLTLNSIALYFWLVPDPKTKRIIRPTFINPLWWPGIIILAGAVVAVGAVMNGLVGALDYFAFAGGAVGLFLLTRKKIDCWAALMATSMTNAALFWLTGSYVMLAATFIFAYNDITAFMLWRREAK